MKTTEPNQSFGKNMKSFLKSCVLLLTIIAHAEESRTLELKDVVKTSLIFEATRNGSKHYPNTIQVILRMENIHDSDVSRVSQSNGSFSAEIIDEKGEPLARPPGAASVLSNPSSYIIPYGSRLEWLISSQGGVSMIGDLKSNYALIIGSNGWLIPIDKLESYSLKVSFRGRLWSRNTDIDYTSYQTLLDIPATKIQTRPNQAPETTILTVTDRAPSSTLRASEDRVSP